jgi:phage anti-repressor protein
MKALIAIQQQTINQQSLPTVSARELHRFLEVGKDFSTWIKGRIEDFEYQQGRDFIVITGSPNLGNQNGRGGDRRSIEYHLTLDMAKELAMLERNAMGRVARKYFIKCEQAALEFIPAMRQAMLEQNPRWRRIAEYQDMGLSTREIGRLLNLHRRSVGRELEKMRQCGFLFEPAEKRMAERSERVFRTARQLPLFPVGSPI